MNNMNGEKDLLAVLVERLEEFGLQVDARERPSATRAEYDLVLSRGNMRQEFAMLLERRATLSSVGRGGESEWNSRPLLVGAQTVAPHSTDALRRAGIQYVDAGGNAWVQFGDLLIDVRGRRPSTTLSLSKPSMAGSLFSTGRAQVAFVLLQWPRLWNGPQRAVAGAAGVSLGQTNNALAMFGEAGFGPGGHRRDSELLDLWVASFPTGLAAKHTLATYQGSIDNFRKVSAEDPVFIGGAVVSGEVAADDLVRPAALTLYVTELDPMLPVKNRWRSDGDSNIIVRRKFWTTPPDETQDYDGPLVGVRTAPAVLVYADLMSSDDPRVRSIAPEWRERIVRRERGQ